MFCKSCGKEIKNESDFCSYCGTKINKPHSYHNSHSQTFPDFELKDNFTIEPHVAPRKTTSVLKNKKLSPIIILILCFVCIFSVFLLINIKKEYPIEGEWISDDLIVLPEVVREYVQNEGYPEVIADVLIEMLSLDDIGTNMTIIFTEDNKILLTMKGISFGSDLLSYQKVGENKILLQFEWSGSIAGTSIPISIGYTGKYKVEKNKLLIDFFGYDVQMTRQAK